MNKLAILISDGGTGSNLQAIIDAIVKKDLPAVISVVVSDTPHAQGLTRAHAHHIPTLVTSDTLTLAQKLQDQYRANFIILAGWKKIVPDEMIDMFCDRILNLHPGLIPDTIDGMVLCPDGTRGEWNRGKFGEKAVAHFLQTRATYAGSTVHFLSHEFDFGKVLTRGFVKILPQDDIDSLYARLKKTEHQLFIEAIKKVLHHIK